MRQAYTLVRENLGVAAKRNKRTYGLRVHAQTYKVGEWVRYFHRREMAKHRCGMVKVKVTGKKGQDELRVAHPCRFPGCNRVFNYRQGMSRHMKLVHGAVAGTLPPVTIACTVARTTASTAVVARSSADVEGLVDAF